MSQDQLIEFLYAAVVKARSAISDARSSPVNWNSLSFSIQEVEKDLASAIRRTDPYIPEPVKQRAIA